MINFYRITSPNTSKVYIGSTKKTLEERLIKHKSSYKCYLEGKSSCFVSSFEILEFKDYKIELLENKFCESKEERDTVECKYIINTPNAINICLPGRTLQQWTIDNKEYLQQYKQQHYNENKEHYQQYKHLWRQNNKERLNEKSKQVYQQNKEKINEKLLCECGKVYTLGHKKRHEKSQKHLTFINSLRQN